NARIFENKKRMTHFLSLSGLLLLLITSCGSKQNPNQQLQEEVIAIHDEVMPLMGSLVRKSMKIDSILTNIDGIKADKSALDTAGQKEELLNLQSKIEESNDAMNKWMREFELEYEGKSDEEIKTYLEQEKVKVEEINRKFKEVE